MFINSLRAGVFQFFFPPTIYFLVRLLANPSALFVNPLDGVVELIAINSPISVGVGFYVWLRNRGGHSH
jgi:hypothetical protein